MQYTLRNVPPPLDSALRRRAKAEGKSLNAVAIDALIRGLGLGETPVRHREVREIAGTWHEDRQFDEAIADQHRIDRSLWR
jgi:plasmid stability protein